MIQVLDGFAATSLGALGLALTGIGLYGLMAYLRIDPMKPCATSSVRQNYSYLPFRVTVGTSQAD